MTDEQNQYAADPQDGVNHHVSADGSPDVQQTDVGASPALLQELENLRNPKKSWLRTVVVLLISVLLFLWLGLLRQSVFDVLWLIGVLFIHEAGHFVGMRCFGYRDVRMFFIPLFGAAVSGRNAGVESYQQAIVILLGPVPGLCIGLLLMALNVVVPTDILGRLALLFLLINGFNLLPIFPLDGGRLLQIVLFSRNRYLESIVKGLAGLALILMGWGLDAWILYVIGGLAILQTRPHLKLATLAQALRNEMPQLSGIVTEEIPPTALRGIVKGVGCEFPNLTSTKTFASLVVQVWERMHTQAPGLLATLCLLFFYATFLAAAVIVPVALIVLSKMLELPNG